MFGGASAQSIKAKLDLEMANIDAGIKVKGQVTSLADEVKDVKQAKAAWESAKSGGASAEEIERLRKTYKAKESAVINGTEVSDYEYKDENGKVIKIGRAYVYKKDDGTEAYAAIKDGEDVVRYNATQEEAHRLKNMIDTGYISNFADILGHKIMVPISKKVPVLDKDGKTVSYKEEEVLVSLEDMTEEEIKQNLGAVETSLNDTNRKVKESKVYEAANANAAETKK